jgi:valyl-tRNA synthetase
VIREADKNTEIEKAFSLMEQLIYTIRNLRGEMKLSPGTATDLYIIGKPTDIEWQLAKQNYLMISALIRTQQVIIQSEDPCLGFATSGTCGNLKVMIPLPEEMLKQEIQRLMKEKEKLLSSLEKLQFQLSNHEFVNKAPEQLIAKHQQQVVSGKIELEEIEQKLSAFQNI